MKCQQCNEEEIYIVIYENNPLKKKKTTKTKQKNQPNQNEKKTLKTKQKTSNKTKLSGKH